MSKNYEEIFYSSLGVFVGLTTFPINKKTPEFFDSEIDELFKWYREGLSSSLNAEEAPEGCYEPTAYYIFGKFDLAFVSLIDDFEICGRTFRPFNHMDIAEDIPRTAYDHKILVGNFPQRGSKPDTIIERAAETFLDSSRDTNSKSPSAKQHKKFPFIGICTAKISNYLLLKEGYHTINDAFLQFFFKEFYSEDGNEKWWQDRKLKVLVIETFGASEYIFLFFSNSYDLITEALIDIRSCRFTHNEDENAKFVTKDGGQGHFVFEYTNTSYGFDFNLFKENLKEEIDNDFIIDHENFYQPIKYLSTARKDDCKSCSNQVYDTQEELISLNSRWFFSPGILKNFKSQLIDKEKNGYLRIASGLGDIVPHTRNYVPLSVAFKNLIDEYKVIIKTKEYPTNYIVESRSFPILKMELGKINSGIDHKSQENKELKKFNKMLAAQRLTNTEILDIGKTLKEMGVAKIVRNKVMKVLANYNTMASNRLLFLFFLDLKNYVKDTILKSLKSLSDQNKSLADRNAFMNGKFKTLESAYYNRFFQSSVTKEITDFNSEYFGAIHQNISAFGYCYNTYTKMFEGSKSSDIVVVGSHPRIESSGYFVNINYFHIFQPEIFAVICCHESSNFFYDKMNLEEENSHLKKFKNIDKETLEKWGFRVEKFTYSRSDKQVNKTFSKQIYKLLKMSPTDKGQERTDFWRFKDFSKKYLNPKIGLMKYFVKDAITLYSGYMGDKELFNLWHWQYFLQMPMNYDGESKINEEKFCIFLIRLMFVLSDINDDGSVSIFYSNRNDKNSKPGESKYQNPLIAPNKILQPLWFKYYGPTRWLIENLLKIPKMSELKEKANLWAKQLALYGNKGYNDEESFVNSSVEDIEKQYNTDLSFPNLEEACKEIIDKFETGAIVAKKKDDESDYLFVTKMIYSFLKYYEKNIWNDGSETLLERHKGKAMVGTENPETPSINYASILIDRQGGLFCVNAEKRKKLFKMRTVFLKSLWDASVKNKNLEFFDLNNEKTQERGQT